MSYPPLGTTLRRLALYWLPCAAYMAAIFWGSSRSHVPGPDISGFDKGEHLVAYAVLGWLLWRAAVTSSAHSVAALAPLWAVLIGTAYGVSDEIHQLGVPGRSCDVADLAADVLGLLVVQGAILLRGSRTPTE